MDIPTLPSTMPDLFSDSADIVDKEGELENEVPTPDIVIRHLLDATNMKPSQKVTVSRVQPVQLFSALAKERV